MRQRPPEGGRKDGHALEKRIRECMAKALIFSGITIALGSVGACENGDYSILQCTACIACGIALGLAGAEIGKEE